MTEPTSVQIGDLVDVPAGADDVCTTRYRVRVEQISSYGISGTRIKANGKPMVSHSIESKSGFVERVVPWDVVAKSAIVKGGAK